mgnify:CR=1 FL=1
MRTLLLIFLLSLSAYAQNHCYENRTGEYWPFYTEPQEFYTKNNSPYTYVYSTDSLLVNGKYYKTRFKEDKKGKVLKAYFRKENAAVYYYNEKTKSPSLLLPAQPVKGYKWESTCGQFVYEIKSLEAKLNTPHCSFTDLLKIEILNKDIKTRFQFFYKKEVGFVGKNIENSPFSFIKPNGEIENTPIAAYGCEHLNDINQRRKCTSSKVNTFIVQNLSNPTPKRHGRVVYSIRIDVDGKVDKVEIVSNDGASKKQAKAGQKVLEMLPAFIPGYVGDKPIPVLTQLPINF